jgi:hypothetical protein
LSCSDCRRNPGGLVRLPTTTPLCLSLGLAVSSPAEAAHDLVPHQETPPHQTYTTKNFSFCRIQTANITSSHLHRRMQ